MDTTKEMITPAPTGAMSTAGPTIAVDNTSTDETQAENQAREAAAQRDRKAADDARAEVEQTAKAEALATRVELDRQAEGVARQAAAEAERTRLKLWVLRPLNRLEPPFHFFGTVQTFIVAAVSVEQARRFAAGDQGAPQIGDVWLDPKQTSCVALTPTEPGVIARDMGA